MGNNIALFKLVVFLPDRFKLDSCYTVIFPLDSDASLCVDVDERRSSPTSTAFRASQPAATYDVPFKGAPSSLP